MGSQNCTTIFIACVFQGVARGPLSHVGPANKKRDDLGHGRVPLPSQHRAQDHAALLPHRHRSLSFIQMSIGFLCGEDTLVNESNFELSNPLTPSGLGPETELFTVSYERLN